jgi:flagellar hook-length control protein FliK
MVGHLAAAADSAQQGAAATAANAALPQTHAVATAPAAQASAGLVANAATPGTVPLSGLAVEIVSQAKEGKHRFEIRLDPPDLGRIDVRLDVDRQGNVTSRLVVDRADTLDLLRRDSTGLERALQDAGLKTDGNGLQFSLRDQNAGQQSQRDTTPSQTNRIVVPDVQDVTPDMPRYYGTRLGGVDIRI